MEDVQEVAREEQDEVDEDRPEAEPRRGRDPAAPDQLHDRHVQRSPHATLFRLHDRRELERRDHEAKHEEDGREQRGRCPELPSRRLAVAPAQGHREDRKRDREQKERVVDQRREDHAEPADHQAPPAPVAQIPERREHPPARDQHGKEDRRVEGDVRGVAGARVHGEREGHEQGDRAAGAEREGHAVERDRGAEVREEMRRVVERAVVLEELRQPEHDRHRQHAEVNELFPGSDPVVDQAPEEPVGELRRLGQEQDDVVIPEPERVRDRRRVNQGDRRRDRRQGQDACPPRGPVDRRRHSPGAATGLPSSAVRPINLTIAPRERATVGPPTRPTCRGAAAERPYDTHDA